MMWIELVPDQVPDAIVEQVGFVGELDGLDARRITLWGMVRAPADP